MLFSHRTWAEIDLNALKTNFNLIKEITNGSKIMSVVKANAYGHSVSEIAPVLEEMGTDFFAVSNIEEALQLREIGITKPILILGYTPVTEAKLLAEKNISQCVYSTEYASTLSAVAQEENVKINIHIKLDTGMSRLGFNCRKDSLDGINEAISAAKMEGFILEGIFTHFAVADRNENEEDGFTNIQYNRFKNAVKIFKENGFNPKICHCCNSAGIINDFDKHFDLCRPGIILYGLTPSAELSIDERFTPVMTLKSVVSMVKEIEEGDTVSYGRTFKADKKIKIATVAAGYADGYPRVLSNKAFVLINGKKAKVLGRICMDQLSVDVTDIEDIKLGDEVILFGKELPVETLANICNTINYEIVCGISPRVPRIIL
ncbi:MAG: alanine racemase [Clostridia bacterium]|nr:alanine racemase [Clostridia bacterium]